MSHQYQADDIHHPITVLVVGGGYGDFQINFAIKGGEWGSAPALATHHTLWNRKLKVQGNPNFSKTEYKGDQLRKENMNRLTPKVVFIQSIKVFIDDEMIIDKDTPDIYIYKAYMPAAVHKMLVKKRMINGNMNLL